MKYIDHLTNFATASLAAGLGVNEIAIYMRIFWRANEEYWPEYVEISLTEIRQLTNIKSEVTVRKSITNLKQKGFIDFAEFVGKKKKYRLLDLSQYKEIEPPQILTYTPTKNNGVPPQILTYTPTKNNGVTCQKPSNDRRSSGPQDYKTNKTYKTIISDSEKSSDLSRVVDAFTQKIAPSISPITYEKLADDVERYGASRVLIAIDRAEQDNKLSLGWVEYLLKNNLEGGKQYGSKKRSGNTGSNTTEDDSTEDKYAHLDVYMQEPERYPWEEEG